MLYMSKLYNMSFIDFEVVLIVKYLMICNKQKLRTINIQLHVYDMTYKRHLLNKCLIATVIDRYTCMRFAG